MRLPVPDPSPIPASRASRLAGVDGQLSLLAEGPSRRRLSVSALVTLRRCPRRFAFSELEGHGTRQPAGASLGSAVHRAVQARSRGDAVDDRLRPYVDTFERSPFAGQRLVAVELPVRLRRGGYLITGRIDAVFEGPTGWDLVDFKTGAAPADPDPADDAQLEVYALAAVEQFGRSPESLTTTYLHLATGERRSRTWSAHAVAEAEGALTAALAMVDVGELLAVPNRTCGDCDALEVCPPGLVHVAEGER